MQGRLEHKLRNEKNIETLLSELPNCVTDYYYSRASAKESKGLVEYIRKIKRFLLFISDDTKNIDVTKITETDVAKYLKSIEKTIDTKGNEKETTFAYRKQVHTILKSFFEYLRKRKIIITNPMDFIDRPSAKDNISRIELDEYDLKNILDAVDIGAGTKHQVNRQKNWKERDKAILLMLMNTGMREAALSEININDIDFICGKITIIDKRHKTHVYVMNKTLRESLNSWLDKRNEILGATHSDALFISNRKTRLDEGSIVSIVSKYAFEGLGYHISPHKLRAAFCTILYDKTGDIEKVRDAVGHSSISTTQRYIVKGNQAREESAFIMDEIFQS